MICRATSFLVWVLLCSSLAGLAQAATPKERALALLKPRGKRVMTEAEAKEVASLGGEVLPVVYDALFSRNAFRSAHWQREALRVLAHTGNKDTIPKIKQYIDRDVRLTRRFEAMRAILEISNTAETREYVVKTVDRWITDRWQRYDHDVEFGLLRLLRTNIPDADKVRVLTKIRLSDFRCRAHIIRNLAKRADTVTIPILNALLAERKPDLAYCVANSIEDAVPTLRKTIETYSSLDLNQTQRMTEADVKRICTESKRAIATLQEEFNVMKIYQDAAQGGDRRALFQLGNHYLTGNLVQKDLTKAVHFLEKSAQKGNDYGQLKIGLCYLSGVGVQKQPEKGFRWILEAAKSGYVEAYYELGLCYRDGKGTVVDLDKAKVWLRKAADFPHDKAKKALRALDGKTER